MSCIIGSVIPYPVDVALLLQRLYKHSKRRADVVSHLQEIYLDMYTTAVI